jgi:hypothetical protein
MQNEFHEDGYEKSAKPRLVVLSAIVSAITAVVTVNTMQFVTPPRSHEVLQESKRETMTDTQAETIPNIVERTAPAVVSVVISADVPVIVAHPYVPSNQQ